MWWLKSLIDLPGALAHAYEAHENAKTERERILWDERVRRLEARKETILQAQKDPVERWVRVCLAFPFVLYINKLVIWDKILKLGTTDPLSSDLSQIMMIIIGGYFVDTVVRRVMR